MVCQNLVGFAAPARQPALSTPGGDWLIPLSKKIVTLYATAAVGLPVTGG